MAACTLLPSPPHNPSHSSSSSLFFSLQVARGPFSLRTQPLCSRVKRLSVSAPERALDALIFDCDGVILESKHLHLQAYNDTFSHFSVRCTSSPSSQPPRWDAEFYDDLQNRIGRGKPKMRWYFKEHGWPTSAIFDEPPEDDSDREKLIDTLQGKKLVVCSAATKSSVILVLENLIGTDRFSALDCFLAGNDVNEKKPDPSIYMAASKRLGVSERNCLVVEDSVIGLQAATSAGMSCVITYTSSTATQDFKEAIGKYHDLSDVRLEDLELLLQSGDHMKKQIMSQIL